MATIRPFVQGVGASQEIGTEIAKMFGLDPRRVSAVHINLTAGEVAKITVECNAQLEEITSIVEKMRRYRWVERNGTMDFRENGLIMEEKANA